MSLRDAVKTTFHRPVFRKLSFLQIFCAELSKVETFNVTSLKFQLFLQFSNLLTLKVAKSAASLPELPYIVRIVNNYKLSRNLHSLQLDCSSEGKGGLSEKCE
jgi:hypothetical protein